MLTRVSIVTEGKKKKHIPIPAQLLPQISHAGLGSQQGGQR